MVWSEETQLATKACCLIPTQNIKHNAHLLWDVLKYKLSSHDQVEPVTRWAFSQFRANKVDGKGSDK
eukprot:CAMPEP_0115167228 /NCGR_PEP_ID=MMETSP0270-20121206/104_1 /TAXON_ID=71861 /ORGANISM="Scrippsiella trochoidea, Strain CCMP3099" /LENGTH=66 /DNA_ID=CAMNT_0002579807 /DNA_START=235 /DNA_END=435 /DNA_ORIENTATION=+